MQRPSRDRYFEDLSWRARAIVDEHHRVGGERERLGCQNRLSKRRLGYRQQNTPGHEYAHTKSPLCMTGYPKSDNIVAGFSQAAEHDSARTRDQIEAGCG